VSGFGAFKSAQLSGQPGRTDVGPGWLQLGACNTRSSLGVSNAFTVVQKIALTAIVDQADNSNKRPLLGGGPMAKPPCGRLWSHRPGEERLIDFLAQMPTGTMILLTMAVLGLAATLIGVKWLI